MIIYSTCIEICSTLTLQLTFLQILVSCPRINHAKFVLVSSQLVCLLDFFELLEMDWVVLPLQTFGQLPQLVVVNDGGHVEPHVEFADAGRDKFYLEIAPYALI